MFGNSSMYPDGGLGFQLSLYRLEDAFDEARRIRQGGALEQAYEQLVDIHNTLVNQYNTLLGQAQLLEQSVQQKDARVADLERRLAAAEDASERRSDEAHEAFCKSLKLERELQQERDFRKELERLHSQQG